MRLRARVGLRMDPSQRRAWAEDGVFVIRNALDTDSVQALRAVLRARTADASDYIRPGSDTVLAFAVPEDVFDTKWGGRRPGSGLLSLSPAIVALVAHQAVLPCLQEAFGAGVPFRLDHDYAFLLRGSATGTQRGGLHGSLGANHITCVWELEDVTAHDGGFAAVKGSHRRDFDWPFDPKESGWRRPPYPAATSHVEAKAGDVILFDEQLTVKRHSKVLLADVHHTRFDSLAVGSLTGLPACCVLVAARNVAVARQSRASVDFHEVRAGLIPKYRATLPPRRIHRSERGSTATAAASRIQRGAECVGGSCASGGDPIERHRARSSETAHRHSVISCQTHSF